jgi:rhamnulokinase
MTIAGRERELAIDGIGVDTWGVDFGILGGDGALLDNPRHYRDPRNNGMLEKTFAVVPREEIFDETGIQFMQLNSLYQLYAMKRAGSPALGMARRLLFMPDLFNYWLTGIQRSERTIASTSQFYNPRTNDWANGLFNRLGLPVSMLADLADPGARLGPLLAEIAETTGLGPVPVYATACHDTAAAVAAVPAQGGSGWCYISSGTWSLMGVEVDSPVINAKTLEMNFTNEVGVGGKIRLLKNIAGLWLLQECRRAWTLDGRQYAYEDLARMAAEAEPFSAVIPPDAFLEPGRMPGRIVEFCRSTGQKAPREPGEMCRAILEGLALRYRQVLESLEALLAGTLDVVHIVGGGARNRVLSQFVADATGRTVIAGPSEATAAGNILVQAIGAGRLSGLDDARRLVRSSFETEQFDPRPDPAWDRAYERFASLS